MTDTSRPVAIIAGSGAAVLLPDVGDIEALDIETPYGKPSHVCQARFAGMSLVLVYRHGVGHTIPPHKINYRANIWALAELGCDAVIALATVGGIRADLKAGDLLVPDQIIDYTWGRESTFFDGIEGGGVGHLETAYPYCQGLRELIKDAADAKGLEIKAGGVYAATQGPRFETAAEIDRIERDGGDVVGMTGMPEATLAAEKDLAYASVNLVVNAAAGRSRELITEDEISQSWARGQDHLKEILGESVRLLAKHSGRPFSADGRVMKF